VSLKQRDQVRVPGVDGPGCGPTPSVDVWQQIGGAVAQFVSKLLAHVSEESRILQQGFNEDPALFDLEENR
jgi:hypothetical protein